MAIDRSYGLTQEFITPHCPQQNGTIERLIRTLKEQCVHLHHFDSIRHATRTIGVWISFYNNRCPHQALAMRTPVEAFRLAELPEQIPLGRNRAGHQQPIYATESGHLREELWLRESLDTMPAQTCQFSIRFRFCVNDVRITPNPVWCDYQERVFRTEHLVNYFVRMSEMLQVWKIEIPASPGHPSPSKGWAVAHSAEEARRLSGFSTSVVSQEPERLWIAKERVVWEKPLL